MSGDLFYGGSLLLLVLGDWGRTFNLILQSKISKYAILRKSIMASIALIDEALTDDSSKSSSQVNIRVDLRFFKFFKIRSLTILMQRGISWMTQTVHWTQLYQRVNPQHQLRPGHRLWLHQRKLFPNPISKYRFRHKKKSKNDVLDPERTWAKLSFFLKIIQWKYTIRLIFT